MKPVVLMACLAGVCGADPVGAYEYTLQFTPASGARDLVVAGYAFQSGRIMGNCSYDIVRSGSGRGGGYHHYTTYFNQTCYWDLHGTLLSIAQGAPTAPTPISVADGVTVYARSANGYTTGYDANRGAAFVVLPSAQYTWLTQSGGYQFLSDQRKVDITLSLQSIGDLALAVKKITPSANLGKATVKSTTCAPAAHPTGATCTIVVTYDPSGIPGGDDPYTAYDQLTVGITSNSGQAPNFTETLEVPISPAG